VRVAAAAKVLVGYLQQSAVACTAQWQTIPPIIARRALTQGGSSSGALRRSFQWSACRDWWSWRRRGGNIT